jgi:pimeloyl-ACP methyl ester carboxylesterase
MGEGSPVVLVHGTPSRSFLWRRVAPVLARRYSVYVYDLLGYGESERRDDHDVSIAVQGRLLAELAGSWGLDRPALVGHDIGGAVILRAHLIEGVAAQRLALVDAVVLRPWITPASRHIQAHLEAYRSMPVHLFREVAAAHLRTATYRPMDEEVFAAIFDQWEGKQGQALWLAHVAGFDESHTAEFEPFLGSMETPTRIIWGDHDAWLEPEVSKQIERRLPQADRVLLPEAGHFSMEDRPTELARALADWLNEDATESRFSGHETAP